MRTLRFPLLLRGGAAPRNDHGRSYLRLVAPVVCTTAFLFGCGSEQPSNNANMVVVNMTNTENMNTMANTTVGHLEPVSSEDLQKALKARLRQAKEGALTPDEWAKDVWLEHPMGLFFKDNDIHSRDAVCHAMEDVLTPRNKRMTGPARKTLRLSVDHSTACKKAVSAMLDASVKTEPIVVTP